MNFHETIFELNIEFNQFWAKLKPWIKSIWVSRFVSHPQEKKKLFLRQFFAENGFSWPNRPILTRYCYTSLESSGSQLFHGIFEKIFCDSCKVSEFCRTHLDRYFHLYWDPVICTLQYINMYVCNVMLKYVIQL